MLPSDRRVSAMSRGKQYAIVGVPILELFIVGGAAVPGDLHS